MVPRGGALARASIEHKLPLLFGSVLIAVIVALSASAIVEMRRTALHAASVRSTSLTQQLAALLQQSRGPLLAQLNATAASPVIRLATTSSDAAEQDAARRALDTGGPQREQVVSTELRDKSGALVLGTRGDTSVTLEPADRAALSAIDSATIGAFRRIGGVTAFPVAVPVPGTAGYKIVQWRRATGSRKTREQLTQLIGSDAMLYVSNRDGSFISDMEQDVERVTVSAKAFTTPQVESRVAAGGRKRSYLTSWAVVPHTPWAVGVEFPLDVILEPVNAFVRRMVLLALIALLAGLFAAWLMSRRLTGPLTELALAADAMSSGDYSRTVSINRFDELGRLGRSFNHMAAEVSHSRQGLEQMVLERTRTLNDTLHQLHAAQESLVRREKLAMLGQLAGGVGHELRNPLGVMTNAVYYLKTVLAPAQPNVLEYLEILQQQISLSEKIVGDLLDFARLKPPVRAPSSLADVTRAQIDRLGPTNGVEITATLPPDLPLVLADDVQVGQIMQNLLINAMQAMDHSGRITIRAHTDRTHVHVDVCDTGPGVAPHDTDRIFEPLFTTKARGIGLGLAVSRTLARANEGELTLREAPGTGADFRLTLPVAPSRVG